MLDGGWTGGLVGRQKRCDGEKAYQTLCHSNHKNSSLIQKCEKRPRACQASFSLPECKTGLGEEVEDCWKMLTLKAKDRETDLR